MNVGHGRHPGHAHMAWGGVPAGPGFARGRALPIVVASGLAMGVFAGLVVVRGTGEAEGKTVASAGSPAEETPEAKPAATPAPNPSPSATPDPSPSATPDPSPSATPDPNPSPNPSANPGTTAGAPKATAEQKHPSMALVTFVGAPRGATILVDGQKIEGTAKEVALDEAGKAQVKVQVKASGYKPYADTIALTGDKKVNVDLDRVRKPSGSGKGGGKKGDGKKGGESPAGPGGLIKL